MKMKTKKIMGIDYGSKLAGTTVICHKNKDQVCFIQSEKRKNSDKLIIENCVSLKPDYIFIDAPLSLPASYCNNNERSPDFFFRDCDRHLNAMSPMFLGGLTARAIQLKYHLNQQNIEVFETYPARQAEELHVKNYKKEPLTTLVTVINNRYNLSIRTADLKNIHYLDALLAYIGGIRFVGHSSLVFGNEQEGLIYV